MRRLRRKSNAKKDKDKGDDREDGNGNGNGNAPLPVPTRRPSRRRQLELKLDDDNFRTSLILPSLTRRFTLLRGKDGSLLSENEMQSHLRVQRATGRLTESEELMVMQQYRLQSMYEAASSSAPPSGRARVNGNGDAPHVALALPALQEQDEERSSSSYSPSSPSTSRRRAYPTGDSVYSALSSSDEHRSRSSGHHTPFSPSSSTGGHQTQHHAAAPQKPSLHASAPASASHSPVRSASTSGSGSGAPAHEGTGFALSSAAEFYAARDAARGNGLFGGGGLERDVLSKMGRSPSLAGAENPGATEDAGSHAAHSRSPPGSSEPTTPSGRRRTRRLASASSSSSAQSEDHHQWSPRAVPPPVPAIRYTRRDEDEYDPYRPKDSDEEEGEEDDEGHHSALAEEGDTFGPGPVLSELHDVPMSRKQFNRLSRVLEDIERELTHTQYHIAQAGPERIAEEDQSEHEEDEMDEDHNLHPDKDAHSEDHDYTNNSGYSYDRHDHSGYSQEHDLDERGDHLSTASSSDRHPHRAFAYDDTEELGPPLVHDGMHSNSSLNESPRLAFPDEHNDSDDIRTGEQEDSRPTSSQPSIIGTVTSETTERPNTLLGVQSQPDPRLSTPHSPGLAYLRATPSPEAHETPASAQASGPHLADASAQPVSVPASMSTRSLASNGTTASRGTSTDYRPPLSAVQSAFPRSASNRSVQHLRQGSGQMLDTVGEVQGGDGQLQSPLFQQGHDQGYTPGHSRAGSAVSSRSGPPLSPPPTFGLPPLPQSASAASIASLMLDTQQYPEPHDTSLTAHHDLYTLASDMQEGSSYNAAQPLSPAAHAEQTARPPSFSAFTFSRTAGHADLRQMNAADGVPAEPQAHGQMSPKGTPLDGVFPYGSQDGQGNQHRQHARPDSMESTGSSWRGMGAGSDSDYDLLKSLSGSLPASPTKATVVSKMDRIHEDEQEEDDRSGDEGDSDDAKRRQDAAVQAFLRDNESGWNLADLRAIQQKLVDSAISREVPADDDGIKQAHSLGSPFLNGEASFAASTLASTRVPASTDTPSPPAAPHVQSPTSVNPALNALRGRASPGHPGSKLHSRPSSPAATTSQRPAHSRQMSTSSLRRVHSPAPESGPPANEEYFDLQQLQQERSEAVDSVPDQVLASPSAFVGATTPRSPPPIPGSLRTKPTRTSNATPSMLIRHVQQQASEATAALKNSQCQGSSSGPSSSGQAASTSSPGPTSPGPMQPRRQLSHRKSAKNLKISGPQFVSASADLESMPTIDTLSTPMKSDINGSPDLARKPSSAGLKFKMRFNKSAGRRDADTERDTSPDTSADMPAPGLSPSAVMRDGVMPHGSNGSKGLVAEPRQSDVHSGLKSLMSKLKRKKPIETALSPRLLPDPLILASPQWSDVPALGSPHSTGFSSPSARGRDSTSRAATTRQGVRSVSSTGTDPMVDTSPLVISPRGSPLASKEQHTGEARSASHRDLLTLGKDTDRSSAASVDSMRKLFEAATALGLDPERVNELVDAAGYRGHQGTANGHEEDDVAHSAAISPNTGSIAHQAATPPRVQHDARLRRTPSSAISMKRSQSSRSRKMSISELADPTLFASTSTLRRQASQGASTTSTRRSVHDRPPTPPPTKAAHRRQVSEALAIEHPMPVSPPMAHAWASPVVHPAFAASASSSPMAQTRSAASIVVGNIPEEEHQPLPVPSAPFMRNGRTSVVSARSFGSYDAKSIYGLYGDEDEEVPPTPDLPDMDMVLASGRIPASTADAKGASVVLAPGLTPAGLNRMHRNSRIELAEYDNGDIAFNIIQSLRDGSGSSSAGMSAGNRETFYPIGLHRRQTSDLSMEEELASPAPPLPSQAVQPEPDPLRLLVKRNQKPPRPEAQEHLPGRTARNLSAAPPEKSRSSILEVYEASDETQVAALIEELTRGLDQGQFNLSRSGTLSNSTFTKRQQRV